MKLRRIDGAGTCYRPFLIGSIYNGVNLFAYLYRLKESKSKISESVRRYQTAKENKSKAIREHLHSRRKEYESHAQRVFALEAARKNEMKTIFNSKIELAALRKRLHELKATNARMMKVDLLIRLSKCITKNIFCFFFDGSQEAELGTKQYVQREQSRIASAYLVHCRETEMFNNILKRIKQIEKHNENIEYRMEKLKIDAIKRAYEKKTGVKITYEFMLHIKSTFKKKMKKRNPADEEYLLTIYSKLTEKNVAKCVDKAFTILTDLKAPYSTLDVVDQAARLLLRIALTVRTNLVFLR